MRLRTIQPLAQSVISSPENMELVPKLSGSIASVALTTSVCPIKENKCYCDESRPESIHVLLRVVEACPATSIQGDECIQDMPFPLLNCSLHPRAAVCFECFCLCTSPFCVSPSLPAPNNQRHWSSFDPGLPCYRPGQTRAELGEV